MYIRFTVELPRLTGELLDLRLNRICQLTNCQLTMPWKTEERAADVSAALRMLLSMGNIPLTAVKVAWVVGAEPERSQVEAELQAQGVRIESIE